MEVRKSLNADIVFETPVQAWSRDNHPPMSFKYAGGELKDGDKPLLTFSSWLNGTLEVLVWDGDKIATVYLVPVAPIINEICKRHGIDYQDPNPLLKPTE